MFTFAIETCLKIKIKLKNIRCSEFFFEHFNRPFNILLIVPLYVLLFLILFNSVGVVGIYRFNPQVCNLGLFKLNSFRI